MSATVSSGERRMSLAALTERAARAATGLRATGAREGGAVAVMLRNDIPFLECMLAASMAGAYFTPINWHFQVDEVEYMLADSAATHFVVHADLWRRIAAAVPPGVRVLIVATPPEIREVCGIDAASAEPVDGFILWDDWVPQWQPLSGTSAALASMSYTSGTTGRPRAVKRQPIPPDAREAYAKLRADWFGHRAGMRTAMIGPLYHSVQATYAYSAVRTGGDIRLEPRFDAERLLLLIHEERLTHVHLVPTMMHRLVRLPDVVKRRYDMSSLEFVVHGAAPCPADVKRRLIEWWGPIVHEYYGTSEAGMVSRSSSEEWLRKPGTVGKPWPGRHVAIYSEDGQRLPPVHEGLIYMSLGPVPDFTYHNDNRRRREIERDGLITNGDVGYLDEDGYLFLCDRKQDVVIRGGTNIWPTEIEFVIAGHPAVADCAVFGIPHDEYGEVPAAAVQLMEGHSASAEELRAFVGARLARFKVPHVIEFRDSLPRDDSGKIFKRLLRDAHWAHAGRRI